MSKINFVSRTGELNRLQGFMVKAVRGQEQICFVGGDAGAGKSSLLAEFARRAEIADETLVVALGECNAQTGAGDPFLPFREILALLTGASDAEIEGEKETEQNAARLSRFVRVSSQALIEVAPDIIGTLIPGAQIVAKAAKFGAEKAGWLTKLEKKAAAPTTKLDENMIFQQIANLLVALAKEQPLLLILDDLQWADNASIALLFHLSRTLTDARILIIGAYRPSDVALGRDGARHPLEATLNEIKRYRGDVLIDLNETSEIDRRAFMEALIDSEPNHLGAEFRAALFAHTGGYPLFTVELLRTMQERGDLVWDGNTMNWSQPGEIDWDAMPARVEGVIEERIGRLPGNLHDILTTACVEGMQFTTQVVARVRAITERDLLKNLSDELERRHHLIVEGGEEKIGQDHLWHYRFGHVLFQKYLYDAMSRGERRLLHGDVARILEELYGKAVDTIALQLAHHDEEAGEDEKAAHYYQRAGEQAAAIYGNVEAIQHFTRALELLQSEDSSTRYDLVQARERIYGLRGERTLQAADLKELERLAEALHDDLKQAQAALRHANYSFAISDNPATITAAEKTVALAQSLGLISLEIEGRLRLAETYGRQTGLEAAIAEFEQTLALSRTINARHLEADSMIGLGHVAFYQSNFALARTNFEQALAIVRDLNDRVREADVLCDLGIIAATFRDRQGLKLIADAEMQISRETGYGPAEGAALTSYGLVSVLSGDDNKAQAQLEEALQKVRTIGDRWTEGSVLLCFKILAYKQGDYSQAKGYIEQFMRLAHEIGNRSRELTGLCHLAGLLVKVGDYDQARAIHETVLPLSQSLGNRFEEGWALIDSSRISQREEHYKQALDLAQAAVTTAQVIGNKIMEQTAQHNIGHALVDLGQLEEADVSYKHTITLHRELYQTHGVEALAGLVRVALAQQDVPHALELVQEILSYIDINPGEIGAADEPCRVYLTCYQALKVANAPHSHEILHKGYDFLQASAVKISDESMRRTFLENVPYNRDLIAAWKDR